jgi:hypothetical protein
VSRSADQAVGKAIDSPECELDASGQPINVPAPDAVRCLLCGGRATLYSSSHQGQRIVYHNYRCDTCRHQPGRIGGGAIVECAGDLSRRIGPILTPDMAGGASTGRVAVRADGGSDES